MATMPMGDELMMEDVDDRAASSSSRPRTGHRAASASSSRAKSAKSARSRDGTKPSTKRAATAAAASRRKNTSSRASSANRPTRPHTAAVASSSVVHVKPSSRGSDMRADGDIEQDPLTIDFADADIDAIIDSAEAVELDDLESILNSDTQALGDFTTLDLSETIFADELVEEPPAQGEAYIQTLEEQTQDQHVSIGMLDLEKIAAEEAKLHAEIEKYEQFREEKLTQKQRKLLEQVIHVKKELSDLVRTQKQKLRDAERLYRRQRRRDVESLSRAFRRAEERLVDALQKRKAEVKTTYGDLTIADGVYTGQRRRRWRIDWARAPQPVQIKLNCIRGLRDKSAAGRLVIAVSMYDRLGGHIMRWSRLQGQEWCGTTLPFHHQARFFSVETDVEQSVFTVCPPEMQIKPAMVFVFELFILKKDGMPFDRPLAWGAFPMLNSNFEVINGKFKLPMMRGDMDPSVITHEGLSNRIARDLDVWLCNLYFDVTRLPRYTSGQREYEVELQYTASLLGHPERESASKDDVEDAMAQAVQHIRGNSRMSPQPSPTLGVNAALRELTAVPDHAHTDVALNDKKEETDDDDVTLYLKRSGPFEFYHRNVLRLTAERREEETTEDAPKTRIEELQAYTNSVAVLDCPHRKTAGAHVENKTAYVWRELVSEYSLTRIKTSTFWITVSCLLLCFWARLYLHYAGQWVFLQALRVPITDFSPRSFTVNLEYQPSLLLVREQLGVVVFGPIAVGIMQIFFICIAALSRALLGRFPEIGYRFILAWCFMAILDPILILIVDVILKRWESDGVEPVGDAFKLYWQFEASDDGGLPGVFITIFLYAVVMFVCAVITYVYLLRLHLNATIVDLYQRLTASDEETFVPYDNELSIFELEYVVRKAEKWRGQHGERRKVAVYDHIWAPDEAAAAAQVVRHKPSQGSLAAGGRTSSDSLANGNGTHQDSSSRSSRSRKGSKDKKGRKGKRASLGQAGSGGRRMSADEAIDALKRNTGEEVTTHVAIHTISLDGSSEIYRQFLRLPDGAIVEVFGTISGTIDRRVQKTLDAAHVDINMLTRESTRIIQDKFHSSAVPVADMAVNRPSAFSLLSVSALAMAARRVSLSASGSRNPAISVNNADSRTGSVRRTNSHSRSPLMSSASGRGGSSGVRGARPTSPLARTPRAFTSTVGDDPSNYSSSDDNDCDEATAATGARVSSSSTNSGVAQKRPSALRNVAPASDRKLSRISETTQQSVLTVSGTQQNKTSIGAAAAAADNDDDNDDGNEDGNEDGVIHEEEVVGETVDL